MPVSKRHPGRTDLHTELPVPAPEFHSSGQNREDVSPVPSWLNRGRSIATQLDRHELLVALVVLAAVLSFAFRDVVFNGRTVIPSFVPGVMGSQSVAYGYRGPVPADAFRVDPGASSWQAEPLSRKVRDAYSHLRFPLWNANAGTGMPLLADTITAPFDPFRLPVFISPSPEEWDLHLLGRFLVAGLFTFLFARLLRIGLPGSLVVAVGYTLSGWFLLDSNNGFLDVYCALPLVLSGVELIILRRRPGGVVLLAVAVALDLVGGLPEACFVTLLLAGGYALYRLVILTLDERIRSTAVRRLALLTIGFAAGFALAMPALLPFAEYVAQVHMIHVPGNSLGLGALQPRWALSLLVPYVNGPP